MAESFESSEPTCSGTPPQKPLLGILPKQLCYLGTKYINMSLLEAFPFYPPQLLLKGSRGQSSRQVSGTLTTAGTAVLLLGSRTEREQL